MNGKLMKRLLSISALLFLAIDASAAATKTPAKKKAAAAPAPAVAKPMVIPKDATPNPDGTYSWADKSGKKYIFTKTPFGISRREDMGANPAFATQPKEQFMKAADHGDTVAFERQTPFGTTKWEKKKTELTEEERHVLERQTAQSAPQQ